MTSISGVESDHSDDPFAAVALKEIRITLIGSQMDPGNLPTPEERLKPASTERHTDKFDSTGVMLYKSE